MQSERWLLPEGMEEVLPPRAWLMERLRRDILDLFHAWGYDLVIPPFVEYPESLLTGTGRDLDLDTFRFTDPASGRQLGVRADITPQVARIDAHELGLEGAARLCYLGTVLHARSRGYAGTRAPLQIGAEIFGHQGVESDAEILQLMLEALALAGVGDCYLDLGHVGIFRRLAREAGLDGGQEQTLFEALQRKAIPELEDLVSSFGVAGPQGERLWRLAELNGSDALERGRRVLAGAGGEVMEAIDHLERLAEHLGRVLPGVPVHYDLAELRGYGYKTGVVFAAFVPGSGQEIARGGRYDAVGEVFGRARPAVGFSSDLKTLVAAGAGLEARYPQAPAVWAPALDDAALRERVAALRAAGRRVIQGLPGQTAPEGAVEVLASVDGDWRIQ